MTSTILRRTQPIGYGWDGCPNPRRHEPGCLWDLDDEHRRIRARELAKHPLPAPRMSVDDLAVMIVRIRTEQPFAAKVMARFRELLEQS